MSRERDPIWQTATPHVEFFIVVPTSDPAGGSGREAIDILRDDRGRPRTLMSFSHVITANGDGPFRIEIFDPSFADIEELLLSYNNAGWGEGELTPEQMKILNSCAFRYGYVSAAGKSLSSSPHGDKYYSGMITSYTPTMRTSGTNLVIEGMSTLVTGADYFKKLRIDSSWQTKPIYTIIKDICTEMDWELRGIGADQLRDLPKEKQPEVLLDAGQSMDTTEETPRTIKIYGDEAPYALVQRLCMYARTLDPKFGPYFSQLQYYVSDVTDNPKGYLYFGPHDPTQDPVRRYVYMRDKHSEVISFSPTVMGVPAYVVGQAGMNILVDDVRHGTMEVQQRSETDRQALTHNKERPKTDNTRPGDRATQVGTPQLDEENAKRVEGTTHGGQSLAPAAKIPADAPVKEVALRTDNRYFGDREGLNYWLSTQHLVQQATLEIFGDPGGSSEPLDIGKLVDVFIFVPTEGGTFKVHYISNRWMIAGLVHQISGGTYITSLELLKEGFNEGGTTSKAQKISMLAESLDKVLTPGMRKLVK